MTAILVIALSQVSASGAAPQSVSLPAAEAAPVHLMACPTARQGLRFYTSRVNFWRARMGQHGRAFARHLPGCPRYLAALVRRKAHDARLEYERWFLRTYEKWRCIHEHEGAWNANTGNGYYGGLQMTLWFQQDRKSTRLNSSHSLTSRMPSSA